MKTATTVCGRCGAAIPDPARQETCPACLLEIGVGGITGDDQERIRRWIDSPRRDDQRVPLLKAARATGILADFGDYELLEEIGRGGQGLVYRAHQKSLNRTVALKVIGRGPWTTETHLKRFRREAEAAASLEHAGIVPIYEVGERDGQCYFSMKFVEGGQLDEVVNREPIPIRRAVELIAKVARTVHYAHQHGILHRDIKPGNVLLDLNGEPHLTDFGLARLAEAESTITATLEVLGTPSYMAPEQAAGGNISKATDVYGLGAVLYQLLTGQPPFAGGTTYETIKLLLETEPRQPRLLNPKIDRDLSTICLKCLEKDPKRRYSSALKLAEDLERCLKHEPIQARRTGIFARGRKWTRRNPGHAALMTLSIALAGVVAMMAWNRSRESAGPAPEKSIAVLPFENLSDDTENTYLAEGIQEEILTRLSKIADLKIISRTSTRRYHSKPGNLSEIAKQLGVANVLEGSVQKTADQVRVNVQLINAETDSHLWADTYDRRLNDIFGVETEIAKRIAESLRAKLTGREEQALAGRPTNNPEAYDAYLRGLAFDATLKQPEKTIDAYERAVHLDPKFALAWARLSRIHGFIYFAHEDATAARRDKAKSALDNAQELAPNSPETLLARGYYQYLVLDDYGAAKTTFKRVSEALPGSSEASYALGRLARRQGHWDEGVWYFEQALNLDPRNVECLTNAAYTYVALRQFTAALKLLDRALDITPNDPALVEKKARIYHAQGNLPEAARLLSGINWQTRSEDVWTDHLRYERKYDEAIRFFRAKLAQADLDPDKKADCLGDLALIQRAAGDTAEAEVTAQEALKLWEPLLKEKPDDPSANRALAFDYAYMGKKDLALNLADRAVMLRSSSKDAASGPMLEESLAVVQAVVGEKNRAISTLTHLLHTPYFGSFYGVAPITPALLRLDPIWDSLRSDPGFQKLCEKKPK